MCGIVSVGNILFRVTHCAASNYPGMFQIWFWGGLAIVIALGATCNMIGNMDPGTNGVIYRMTTLRLKSN